MLSRVAKVNSLSQREQKVMQLSREGFADKEIAAALGISIDTVRTYWKRIKAKFAVDSRSHVLAIIADGNLNELREAAQTEREGLTAEITRRIDVEQLLQESELRLKLFYNTIENGVLFLDAKGHGLFANTALTKLIACKESELQGDGWHLHLCSERIDCESFFHNRHPAPLFHQVNDRKGRLIDVTISPLLHDDHLFGYVIVAQQAGQDGPLGNEMATIRKFVDGFSRLTDDIIFVFDLPSGTIEYVNTAGERFYGLSYEQLREMGPHAIKKFVHPDDLASVDGAIEQLLILKDDEQIEIENRTHPHFRKDVLLKGGCTVLLRDETGKPVKAIGRLEIIENPNN